MSNLEVHHKEFRSHTGEDSELNLITLCASVTPVLMGLGKATTASQGAPQYSPVGTGRLQLEA